MAVISRGEQKKISLDLYDKKIIFYISQNSRESLSSLSKKLKISPQRIKYKIGRLTKEILEPGIFMNFNLLNIKSYMIYLQECDSRIINKLMGSNSIYLLMQCIGKYQWVINIVTNDIDAFCIEYLSQEHFDIYPITRSIPDDYNPFNLSIKPNPLKRDTYMDLNKLDYTLLTYLAKNPVDSVLKISQETKLDRKTIRERIQRYQENNFIQKFRYGINIFKMGFLVYTLKIETVPNMKRVVLELVRKNIYSGFVFESYNIYSMHFLPASHNDLINFIEELKKTDPSIKIEVIQNTEFFKIQLVPDSVIEILKGRIH